MHTPQLDNIPLFCAHKNPVSIERAIVDSVDYDICSQCGLPIEGTGIPVDEEEPI